jgi:hypothetical protein
MRSPGKGGDRHLAIKTPHGNWVRGHTILHLVIFTPIQNYHKRGRFTRKKCSGRDTPRGENQPDLEAEPSNRPGGAADSASGDGLAIIVEMPVIKSWEAGGIIVYNLPQ